MERTVWKGEGNEQREGRQKEGSDLRSEKKKRKLGAYKA